MPNHVHLVGVPQDAGSLHLALKPLHMRYAQRVNRARGWRGHLWQGRYFSCALDGPHAWAAIRYAETNPVRAGLAAPAEEYRRSSAAGHCGLREDALLWTGRLRRRDRPPDWAGWLAEGAEPSVTALLRRNTEKGLPCGSEAYVRRLERESGRDLGYRPRGRPRTGACRKG